MMFFDIFLTVDSCLFHIKLVFKMLFSIRQNCRGITGRLVNLQVSFWLNNNIMLRCILFTFEPHH